MSGVVIDTSAVLAVVLAEEEAEQFAGVIERAERCSMSAANYLAAAIVIESRGDAVAVREFDRFMRRSGIEIEAVTREQAALARQAYRDFSKAAGLNFGDCLAYALAKVRDEPLLFKGGDFGLTDVEVCHANSSGATE